MSTDKKQRILERIEKVLAKLDDKDTLKLDVYIHTGGVVRIVGEVEM